MADTKITGLTALTGANLATGDVFVLTDVSDTTMDASGTNKKITADELRTGIKGARAVSDTHTDSSAVNTTTETVVAQQAIPTTVVAGDVVRLTAYGDSLQASGGTVNYTLKGIVGATAAVTTQATAVGTTATLRHTWRAQIDVLIVATNDQRVGAKFDYGPASGNNWGLATNLSHGPGYGTATEDLTAGKDLKLSVIMSVANASADFVCHGSWLEVIKR